MGVQIFGPHGDPGPLGVNWRPGGWVTATDYSLTDAINHNGSSYFCLIPHTSGALTEPGVGADWAIYWDLIAEGGADGVGVPVGGADGDVLTKVSGTDFDTAWEAPSGGASFSGVRANKTGAQSLANNTDTALTFQAESYDTDSYHDNLTNPSRITIPANGYYLVVAHVDFSPHATGFRFARIRLGGSTWKTLGTQVQAVSVAGENTRIEVSDILSLTAGQYLEIVAAQTSGGNLNVGAIGTDYGTTVAVTKLGS